MKGKYSLRMRSYYMLIVFFVVLFCVGTACGGLILCGLHCVPERLPAPPAEEEAAPEEDAPEH